MSGSSAAVVLADRSFSFCLFFTALLFSQQAVYWLSFLPGFGHFCPVYSQDKSQHSSSAHIQQLRQEATTPRLFKHTVSVF